MAPSRTFVATHALLSTLAVCDAMRHRRLNRTLDHEPHPPLDQVKPQHLATWVTLGDSYSSGAGIHTAHSDYEGGYCYRDWSTVPGAKYAAENGMHFINKACGGARITNIHPYLDILAVENSQETAAGWEGSVFSITAGGNDLMTYRGESWMDLLIRCVLTPEAGGGCSAHSDNEVANTNDVKANLTALYSRLAQFAPKAQIRVVLYPVLLQYGSGPCWGVPGLSGTECGWLDRMTDQFNGAIASAVRAAKLANPGVDLEYTSIRSFVTRGACNFWDRQVNPIVVSFGELDMSPATLHPTQAGYDAMLSALKISLR